MIDWENPAPPSSSLVAGICRCAPGQHPSSSYEPTPAPPKPAPGTSYDIERAEVVGQHLVLRVNFKCSYEGRKTIVFLNTSTLDALRWKKIDPHFRRAPAAKMSTEAPPPAARFPSTDEGWADAVAYARSKS